MFGGDTDVMKSVSVTEGDSVSLNTDVTEVQRDDQILWMFGPQETRIAELYKQSIDMFSSRLQTAAGLFHWISDHQKHQNHRLWTL